jgi:hypothetical protein
MTAGAPNWLPLDVACRWASSLNCEQAKCDKKSPNPPQFGEPAVFEQCRALLGAIFDSPTDEPTDEQIHASINSVRL